MTRTKLDTPAFADQSVDSRNIADGAVQAQDITGLVTGTQLAGSITNDKLVNNKVTLAGTEVTLGTPTSVGILVSWQAVTVADGSTTLTAEAGKGYFLDTNTGVIEVFLPTSPSRGDVVILVDYSGTFATNQLIINTGGRLIDSTTGSEFKVTTNNAIVELVYVDGNKGWLVNLNQAAGSVGSPINTGGSYDASYIAATGGTVTTDGNFKVHAFTGDGDFVVSAVGNDAGSNKVDYLVVAGGGGGGADRAAGGGGGGFRTGQVSGGTGLPVTATTIPITVGGGGAAGTYPSPTPGSQGSNSVFSTITSTGGGTGAKSEATGGNGGSGGGGGGGGGSGSAGGSGNTPPVSPPQGNDGGAGANPNSPTDTDTRGSGGGGGAGSAGQDAVTGSYPGSGKGGNGGNGSPVTPIFGDAPKPFYAPTNGVYAGGGGGGTRVGTATGGDGGPGGGGDGGDPNAPTAGAGVANTGGGGGGAEGGPTYDGAAGGKGVVLIRYKFQN